jgi:hypothetical protein
MLAWAGRDEEYRRMWAEAMQRRDDEYRRMWADEKARVQQVKMVTAWRCKEEVVVATDSDSCRVRAGGG